MTHREVRTPLARWDVSHAPSNLLYGNCSWSCLGAALADWFPAVLQLLGIHCRSTVWPILVASECGSIIWNVSCARILFRLVRMHHGLSANFSVTDIYYSCADNVLASLFTKCFPLYGGQHWLLNYLRYPQQTRSINVSEKFSSIINVLSYLIEIITIVKYSTFNLQRNLVQSCTFSVHIISVDTEECFTI